MTIEAGDILSAIRQDIAKFHPEATSGIDVGTVLEAGDGIARVKGLPRARYNELLEFPHGIMGIALNLERESIAAILFGDYTRIKEGDEVLSSGKVAEVPVGDELIGRVISPIGIPLDGKGALKTTRLRPLEAVAPGIPMRASVDTPIQTGIKAVDSMIPIGRGQRELIIGDRSTGKTAIALDTIINQWDSGVRCIYVAIGQKQSKVVEVVSRLKEAGAMKHTTIVTANASDPAAIQYLAPYAGCAVGEEFMAQGKDALVVYDDLSKHAWAYRQLSLLLRRPSGREAYPGDIFYLHSRLLERAAKLSLSYGGGSLTALPIVETQANDVSAYIPTNVISITDGQIYLETDLFNIGVRPALNVGISVSRVGSTAQTKAMKQVAGRLRLELSRYQELVSFAQFGMSGLDKSSQEQIRRGQRFTEVLKQPCGEPMSLEKQVMILYLATQGYLDSVEVEQIISFEAAFHRFMEANHPEVGSSIAESKMISPETEDILKAAILEFKNTWDLGKLGKPA